MVGHARRPFTEAVAHAPQALRALVRADEVWLVVLAAMVGLAAGLIVVTMGEVTEFMHRMLFGLGSGEFLSAMLAVQWQRALAVPCIGGLALGASTWALARWRPNPIVDPIEANALYGGRLSLRDSLVVVA